VGGGGAHIYNTGTYCPIIKRFGTVIYVLYGMLYTRNESYPAHGCGEQEVVTFGGKKEHIYITREPIAR
jgi:hypothetical protein